MKDLATPLPAQCHYPASAASPLLGLLASYGVYQINRYPEVESALTMAMAFPCDKNPSNLQQSHRTAAREMDHCDVRFTPSTPMRPSFGLPICNVDFL